MKTFPLAIADHELVEEARRTISRLYKENKHYVSAALHTAEGDTVSAPPEKMAETYVYLAASPEVADVSGSYFDEANQKMKSSKKSYNREAWERLWTVSNQLTGITGW